MPSINLHFHTIHNSACKGTKKNPNMKIFGLKNDFFLYFVARITLYLYSIRLAIMENVKSKLYHLATLSHHH